MTTTSIAPTLVDLVTAVRQVIDLRADWARTAELVADQLRAHLPGPEILTPDRRRGDPDRPAGHVLHAEPDGTFSVLGLVLLPGQTTRIYDHITWCVVGVLAGTEHEELFDESLNPMGVRDNPTGDVSGFATPDDIHRIRNDSHEPPSAGTSTAPTSPGSGPARAASTTERIMFHSFIS